MRVAALDDAWTWGSTTRSSEAFHPEGVKALLDLDELGLKLRIVLGAAGLATVAIGLAAQATLASLLSGFILHGERPFSVGDEIDVGGTVGEVLFTDLMATRIRTPDNRIVRIPNELLVRTKVVNQTRLPLRRLDLSISISHHERIDDVRALLLEVAEEHSLCFAEPRPRVQIVAFRETSTELELRVWTRAQNYVELRRSLADDVHRAFERWVPPQ